MNINIDSSKAKNNQTALSGELLTDFRYVYENSFGKIFYEAQLKVDRLSGTTDIIPITVPEKMLNEGQIQKGSIVSVKGQLRSHNQIEGERHRLMLSVWVQEMELAALEPDAENNNQISLNGYICKEPGFRKTPLGREIADLLVAVNRSYGKSDYIPCICWGEAARYAAALQVGEPVQISGRIQSREYIKRTEENECQKRTAYEVSAKVIAICEK